MGNVCKSLLILAVGVLCAEALNAKEPDKQTLGEWASEQTLEMPEIVNGVKMYRPEAAGEMLLISDMVDVPNASADQIFLKTLMYVKEKLDPAYHSIQAVDFKNRRFTLTTYKQPGSDPQVYYSYTSAFQGTDGLLSFTCGDIKVDYKEKGLISRSLNFEKLKPAENPRHRKWTEDQALQFSSIIKDIEAYIPLRDAVHVTAPEYIGRGEVVVDMTPDDVLLTLGMPFSKKKSGDRDKWLFDSGTSIIFTNGRVSNIMY